MGRREKKNFAVVELDDTLEECHFCCFSASLRRQCSGGRRAGGSEGGSVGTEADGRECNNTTRRGDPESLASVANGREVANFWNSDASFESPTKMPVLPAWCRETSGWSLLLRRELNTGTVAKATVTHHS